jgi:hypothetical protein
MWYGTGKVFALACVNAITLGETGEWARDVLINEAESMGQRRWRRPCRSATHQVCCSIFTAFIAGPADFEPLMSFFFHVAVQWWQVI